MPMESFDVVIVGASFSGLTLAHHLSGHLKVLVVDSKPGAGSSVESTGLITSHTREEFLSFFDVDHYITNKISSICVVSPNYDDFFISSTHAPWIYQTDTKKLVRALADSLPKNVTFRPKTTFISVNDPDSPQTVTLLSGGEKLTVGTRFLVGADGGHSKVASVCKELDQSKKFLFGYEQVFFGDVHLGPNPPETIYHFWFGEFSLGYGGWLSPTAFDGKKAFRVGLAKKMKDRGEAMDLMRKFLDILMERKIITIDGDKEKPDYVFGSHIPIGGTMKRINHNNVLLIGDAAGLCGAFAADGIKGSIISGKEAAPLIERFLKGDIHTLSLLKPGINKHHNLMQYYAKQVRYRWIWDRMKSDRTFMAMYNIIKKERESFLDQFCDSKNKRRSLTRTVLKPQYLPELIWYSLCIFMDLFKRR